MVFDIPIDQSSWVALRILGTAHTNPVFVIVGDRRICASRRSVQWLADGVEQLWREKESLYAKKEMSDAVAAYDHARVTYRRLLGQCNAD